MELEKYELTKQAILNGEYAEFDAVEKPRREKRPMYLAEVVDQVVEDTFADLRSAYQENDDLTAENGKLKKAVEDSQTQLLKANGASKVKQSDDIRLKKAESLLSDMEKTFNNYKVNKAKDEQQIKSLQQQLSQAPATDEVDKLRSRITQLQKADKEREENYQSLATDVNAVLDKLEEKFADLPTGN
jgi:hypothetical protein